MGRPKGSKNKTQKTAPHTVAYSTAEKLEFIATVIVDKIIHDQEAGSALLKRVKNGYVR